MEAVLHLVHKTWFVYVILNIIIFQLFIVFYSWLWIEIISKKKCNISLHMPNILYPVYLSTSMIQNCPYKQFKQETQRWDHIYWNLKACYWTLIYNTQTWSNTSKDATFFNRKQNLNFSNFEPPFQHLNHIKHQHTSQWIH